MKRIFLSLILALILMGFNYSVSADKYLFKVLALNGEAFLKKGKSNKWVPLKTGDKLYFGDSVKIGKNSYLGLVHSSGRTKELTETRIYSAGKLSKSVSVKPGGLSKRLTNFIFEEIGDVEDVLQSDDYHYWLQSTASVERGIEPKILLSFPNKTNLLRTMIHFAWRCSVPDKLSYEFYLFDSSNKEVYVKEISETSILIDLLDLNFEKDIYYRWNVKIANSSGFTGKNCSFKILSEAIAAPIKDSLRILKEELGTENSAIQQIILAAFYEKHNLMLDAMKSYLEAVRLAPDVEEYKRMYYVFLYKIRVDQ